MFSFFYKEDFSILNFNEDYKNQLFNFIENITEYDEEKKNEFKNIIIKLGNTKNFLEEFLVFLYFRK